MQRIFAWAHSHVLALRAKEEGQTMAEYGVVLALITALVAFAFTSLGQAIIEKVGEVTGILNS